MAEPESDQPRGCPRCDFTGFVYADTASGTDLCDCRWRDQPSLEAALLRVLLDEYGGTPEDWTAMGSLRRVANVARERLPRVEIDQQRDKPTTCKVWRNGVPVFDGVDRSVLL